jgi:hypothetical protein
MSDEIRGLIGRYATEGLTESEKKLLFEAALEDQDLFDELAGEHALKQLLEQPGVRARLIGSLAPAEKKVWPRRWATASLMAAAAVFVAVLVLRPPAARQIAQVSTPAPLLAPSPVVKAPDSATIMRAPTISPKTPAISQPKSDRAKSPEPEVAAQPTTIAEPAATAEKNTSPVGGAPVPVPLPQLAISPAVTAFKARNMAANIGSFAFNYEITSDHKVRVTPASGGFLSVSAIAGASPKLLAANQPARPGAVSEFEIPSDGTLVTVILSVQPVPQEAPGATFGGALDGPSGTKIDPNPTVNSRLTAVIPVTPR